MKVHHASRALIWSGVLTLFAVLSPTPAVAQVVLDSGNVIFLDHDGTREELFTRGSFTCPAAAAPDAATWITVDSATLNGTNAKAAMLFAHAFAQQDGTGEPNGVGVYLAKGGSTPTPDVTNQVAQSHVDLAGEHADEHSVMIVPLDANKDFNVYYKFGEVLSPSTDETQLCRWAVRVQLVGYVEDGNVDSDGDGLPDDWETANGLDPNDASGVHGADGDPDGDGAANVWEYLGGTDPQSAASLPQSAIQGHQYQVVAYPGAQQTWLNGVNDAGIAVGGYSEAATGAMHGLLWSAGTFTVVDCAGAMHTWVNGINDVGQVVGSYLEETVGRGFVRAVSGGPCTLIDVPGAQSTWASGINDAGQIVGGYWSGTIGGGFVREPSGALTLIAVPGAQNTWVSGINDAGEITGTYVDGVGLGHGFVHKNGVFTWVDLPGAATITDLTGLNDSNQYTGMVDGVIGYVVDQGVPVVVSVAGAAATWVAGLNDAGVVVGNYTMAPSYTSGAFVATPITFPSTDSDGDGLPDDWETANGLDPNDASGVHGADGDPDGDGAANVWEYLGGTDPQDSASVPQSAVTGYHYTLLAYPGATLSGIAGINDVGQAVGQYSDGSLWNSFLLSGGVYSTLACAGASQTAVWDINNAGQVVGWYEANGTRHGFVRDPASGMCAPLDAPGATETFAMGINDAGQVVGFFTAGPVSGPLPLNTGFVWSNGVFTSLDVPGAMESWALGINESGVIAGVYADSGSPTYHGVIWNGGVATRINAPGSDVLPIGAGTELRGINNLNQYTVSRTDAAFLPHAYVLNGGVFVGLQVPGAAADWTQVYGINDAGVVVGGYPASSTENHGFVAIPITPGLADSDGDGLPDAWEVLFGLNPNDSSDAGSDSDGDGISNHREFIGGTDPQNSSSAPTPILAQDNQNQPLELVVPPGVDSGAPGFSFQWVDPASIADPPPPGSFPYGLVSMALPVTPGATVTVAITFQGPVATNSAYHKYGATSVDPADHWYAFPFGSNDGDATITLTLTDGGAGDHDLTVNGVIVDPGGPFLAATDGELINISSRARVETGDNVMIGGFWIGGTGNKTVLIRARGGSLGGAPFNNPGVLANPTMQLFSGSSVIAQNNDWGLFDGTCVAPCANITPVSNASVPNLTPCEPNPGQSTAPPGCAQESAILVDLPPGGYTAIMSGVGGTSGMGLVEVFEISAGTASLINVSTRSRVQTGDNVMIGGFWIGGTTPKNVLIRARGGSLGGAPFNNPGVLANPTMQVFSGSTVVAQNNDWGVFDNTCVSPCVSTTPVSNTSVPGLTPCEPNPGQSTAPPGCAQESAVLVTLAPGGYTAIVSGVGATSGMGLVEVFEVP